MSHSLGWWLVAPGTRFQVAGIGIIALRVKTERRRVVAAGIFVTTGALRGKSGVFRKKIRASVFLQEAILLCEEHRSVIEEQTVGF